MRYFAGLDVSLEETAICVVDETGLIMKEARAASEPEALDTLLSSLGLPLERLELEACSLTAWLHGELKAAGWPAICIESRQAKAAMGAMPNETDRNDARAIAQIMRTGLVPRSACKNTSLPFLAFALGRASDGAQRDADDRKRCSGHLA
jgi:transposase